MPDFKAKNPNSISAGALPQISLGGAYSALPDLLTEFNGPTSKGLEKKRWEMGVLRGREGRGGHPEGLVYTPMSEILRNTLTAELI